MIVFAILALMGAIVVVYVDVNNYRELQRKLRKEAEAN